MVSDPLVVDVPCNGLYGASELRVREDTEPLERKGTWVSCYDTAMTARTRYGKWYDAGRKDASKYYKGYIEWLERSLAEQIKGRVSTGVLLAEKLALPSARAERFDTLPLKRRRYGR